MALIVIRDLDQTRRHFENAVRLVGEDRAKVAFNRALNSEGQKVRTLVRRELRKQTGAKAELIARETKGIRSTFSTMAYTIEAKGGFLGLSHFNPRQFSYGVRAKPWGRSQRFERAFIVSKLSNNVFTNTREYSDKSGRNNKLGKMFGPAIPREMMRDATRDAFEKAQPDVLTEARRQLQRMIEGAR